MLKLETKSDLERLKNDDIQERVTLEYKDAAALGKTSPQWRELCKDVSAFANSEVLRLKAASRALTR